MSFTWLTAAWAWVSGLGWVAKAAGAFGILSPALMWFQPVLTVLGILWTAVKTFVAWVFEAVELTATHPVILSLLVLAYIGGRWQQHAFDEHLVDKYKVEAQNIAKKVQGASDVEKSKAEAAIAARDAAEKEAKKIAAEAATKIFPLVEPNATVSTDHPVKAHAPTIALDPGPTAAELRKSKGVRRGSECAAVFCF